MPLQETSGTASYDAFGGGAAVTPVYIEDVYSTFLYTGNGSTQTITNGIDLAGKGGLFWMKNRGRADYHFLVDSTRGLTKGLASNTSGAQETIAGGSLSFQATGVGLSGNFYISGASANESGQNYVGGTFRKQPKFFDVVTGTTNSSGNCSFSHSLASEPGCVIFKFLNDADNWVVYHRGMNGGTTPKRFWNFLNLTNAQNSQASDWISLSSTTVSTSGGFLYWQNKPFVAYLFAHNAGGFGLTGTDNVISCGSFTGNTTVNLGYEPQWVLLKNTALSENWVMFDNMRGLPADFTQVAARRLYPNLSNAESSSDYLGINATGFTGNLGAQTYIYIAIRRGPMKTPTSGTSVFKPLGTSPSSTTSGVGFPADMSLAKYTIGAQDWLNSSRLTSKTLYTNSTAAEDAIYGVNGPQPFDTQDGFKLTGIGTSSYAFWAFQRAPGFFDEVCYTGTGSSPNTQTHNLKVAPELVIVKSRTTAYNWAVWHSFTGADFKLQYLNTTAAAGTISYSSTYMPSAPTASQIAFGTTTLANDSGGNYVAYLFASCPGVSKVFSFTGNGSTQTINCGFTGGARFVLLKATSTTGDWYVYDTARGMTTLTDPYLLLNSTAAESATLGSVTSVTGGFAVNASILAAINTNGVSYIGIAIA